MKAAPAFDCARCGRRIGKAAPHWLVKGAEGVRCTRCMDQTNAYDDVRWGTRAYVAYTLGLWGDAAAPAAREAV